MSHPEVSDATAGVTVADGNSGPAAKVRPALIGITVLGGLLRFATLGEQSFWLDEAFTADLVSRSFGDMLDGIAFSESTPPLYYALAWGWSRTFGITEFPLRSLSALLGTAAIPVAYAVGAELRSRSEGLALAALAATSPLLVWYSQEARSYSLLFLLTALSLWLFARSLRQPSPVHLITWALVSGLALAVHYFAVFVVLPEAVWLLAMSSTRRRALLPVAGVGLIGAVLLPLAIHQESLGRASSIAEQSLRYRLLQAPKQLLLGYGAPLGVAAIVVGAALALVGCGLAIRLLKPRMGHGLRIALGVGTIAIGFPILLTVAGIDYFTTRNLIAAWLPLAVVVTAGLLSVRGGVAAISFMCGIGVAAVIGIALQPGWQRDDWRGISAAIGPPSQTRAILVQPVIGLKPLWAYRDGARAVGDSSPDVKELVVVAPVLSKGDGSSEGTPPRPAHPVAPRSFQLVERRYTDSFSLLRFRARRPQDVSTTEAQRAALSAEHPWTLYRER